LDFRPLSFDLFLLLAQARFQHFVIVSIDCKLRWEFQPRSSLPKRRPIRLALSYIEGARLETQLVWVIATPLLLPAIARRYAYGTLCEHHPPSLRLWVEQCGGSGSRKTLISRDVWASALFPFWVRFLQKEGGVRSHHPTHRTPRGITAPTQSQTHRLRRLR
jgi:hypothetical protein